MLDVFAVNSGDDYNIYSMTRRKIKRTVKALRVGTYV